MPGRAAFQFKIRKRRARKAKRHALRKDRYKEEVGLIHGKQPGSKEEWRVAQALDKHKIDYLYQVPIMGGRWVSGGQVVDFVVYNPMRTPLQVHGEYWHSGQLGMHDLIKLAAIRQVFGKEPIVLWGTELKTQEMADEAIRKKVL